MSKPGMMMVPHLGMVHTIFQGQSPKVKVIAYVCILSYSPHHWTDHDQTWHDDGPPPRDGAHHFSRSRSKVKVIAYVGYIYSPTAHTTGPIMTKPGMMMVPHLGMVHTIFQGKGQRSRS